MTTLTDRYVWAVLRAVPESQRLELEPELRALVADTVEAKSGAGAPGVPVDAERAALVELGDPEQLAARYSGRRQELIGARLFPAWRRVVVTLLAVVVPIVGLVTLGSNLLGESTFGETAVAVLGSSYLAAVMVVFWVTFVFAVIDWTGTSASIPELQWNPDRLPEVPGVERIGGAELIGAVVTSLVLAAFILWQQLNPWAVDGASIPILDPALWSFWLPYFLVIITVEIVFTIGVYLRGRWTYPLATINATLSLGFAIPALWLLWTGQLFNPALVTAIDEATGGDWLQPTVIITALVIGIIVAWDAIEAFVKAHRNARLGLPGPAVDGRNSGAVSGT